MVIRRSRYHNNSYLLSAHDVGNLDVDHDVSTAYCYASLGVEVD